MHACSSSMPYLNLPHCMITVEPMRKRCDIEITREKYCVTVHRQTFERFGKANNRRNDDQLLAVRRAWNSS